ncbi:hypothetical protein [Vitreoscilla sp. C1]|uniref:hypothetical protein n=1 Tax=Vitreoscilla sp. (strain C1) TaxID=96942 RepID=UPI000CDC40DE|nr:hypothetical protein [Vitreoscilla sp. C1]
MKSFKPDGFVTTSSGRLGTVLEASHSHNCGWIAKVYFSDNESVLYYQFSKLNHATKEQIWHHKHQLHLNFSA